MNTATVPETRYLKRGDHFIAYQLFGDGPLDIVLIRTALNHLEGQWEEPRFARFMSRLASFARVITFDSAGLGMSDPLPDKAFPGLDLWCDDQLAVMDAVGCERAAVVIAGLAPFGFLMAASHPDRVSAVVAIDNMARVVEADDYPLGLPDALVEASATAIELSWGTTDYALVHDAPLAVREWLARYRRMICSPGTARNRTAYLREMDVRHILGAVRVPTLLIAHSDVVPFGAAPSHYMAERMPDAQVVEIPGRPLWFWAYPDVDAVVDEIEQFLTGVKGAPPADRVLATVAFTDIVASTSRAAELGDRRWLATVEDFQAMARAATERFGGRLIKWTGDGHLATFDAPGRAIRWASALRGSVGRLGVDIRAGLHAGEVELRDDDIGGMAVNIGRRVCDLGDAQQVLVSPTVPPLVVGSGFTFADRGTHTLRGVPGVWQLFEVS